MKAVLVATIDGEKNLYYILDAKDDKSDGVIDDGKKPRIVSFWRTAMKANNLVPLRLGKFYDYLWDGATGEDPEQWERIFLAKNQEVEKTMTSGLTISNDVMKAKTKEKSITTRAMEFKTLKETQNLNIIRNKVGRQ
jgi:hypothetical protein